MNKVKLEPLGSQSDLEVPRTSNLVEAYLNSERSDLPIDFDADCSVFERFRLHTIKRLKRACDLYRTSRRFQNDFLLALRDYLLTFNTDLRLEYIAIPQNNGFGLSQDSDGRCYVGFRFPEYVNHTFVERAFLREEPQVKYAPKEYNLRTDPLIFQITGYSHFKSMAQKLAVYGAVNTPDAYTTLVSLPTGGGKSLITQTLAYQMKGLTIIIVPTVSLAIDQVRMAKGIIHSRNVNQEIFSYSAGVNAVPILKAIKELTARLLFISPEALINNPGFSDAIQEANKLRYLKNIIIDEAHIVVDWGASFRVDYQCLESWRKKLLSSNPGIRTILLSATYERRCVDILRNFFSQDGKWIEVRCDSLRHEPHYSCIWNRNPVEKQKRMLELVNKLPHPMIIYVARPDEAEAIRETLQKNGILNVRTFTGLTPGSKREKLLRQWADDQFEIMVATSAFGVGVDKSDVRTVLHLCIPQNPNAYYQELGRGGRDRLPCLSIMCIDQDDQSASFQRISKRVMTVEKIIGRWDSIYNSATSTRVDDLIFIDTTVKPGYNSTDDTIDDTPATNADMNWNIYVLLLLRRFNLIRIREVLPQPDKTIFAIEIIDNVLRTESEQRTEYIVKIREQEWDYFNSAYKRMIRSIRERDKTCWSEMFYETYDKVSEYCAGCNTHPVEIDDDHNDFALKADMKAPLKELGADQRAILIGGDQIICFTNEAERDVLLTKLLGMRLSAIVTSKDVNLNYFLTESPCKRNLMVLDDRSLRNLIKRHSYFYLSGMIAVIYSGTPQEVYDKLRLVDTHLVRKNGIGVIHILTENTYFDWIDKTFADLVGGPVVPVNAI